MTFNAWIPHEVVSLMVEKGMTPVRAWREHLGLAVDVVAAKMDIAASVYQQIEETQQLPQSTRELVAATLGILPEQLDV